MKLYKEDVDGEEDTKSPLKYFVMSLSKGLWSSTGDGFPNLVFTQAWCLWIHAYR